MSIRLATLGGLKIFSGDEELSSLPAQKLRGAILVYLAVEREAMRDSLLALLWPERDDDRARHALNQNIYELRRTLGEECIEVRGDRLRVSDEIQADAPAFARAVEAGETEAALALYGGPFLSGVYLVASPGFEEWVARRRAQYERLHRRARRQLIDARMATGDLAAALAVARQGAELDPLDDESQHRVIELLAALGQRNEALRHYEAYRERLATEELQPLDATEELIASIRRGDTVPSTTLRPRPERVAQPEAERPEPAAMARFEAAGPAKLAWRARRVWVGVGTATLIVIGAALVTEWSRGSPLAHLLGAGAGPAPDSSRYLVLPFEELGPIPEELSQDQRLHDALARWRGLSLVDRFQVTDAVARRGGGSLSARSAREIALELGAGRLIRGEVSRVGNALRVYAALYDATRRNALMAQAAERLSGDLAPADSLFAALADSLLLEGAGFRGSPEGWLSTRSLPARLAYARGHAALEGWDFPGAATEFRAATSSDPDYAEAYLWLAQVKAWEGQGASEWHGLVEQAVARRDRLARREQQLAAALLELGAGEYQRACEIYRGLVAINERDFAGWFGLGECHRRDKAVIRDPSSASGWRFQSSYHRAVEAYRRAFVILPSAQKGFQGAAYQRLRELFFTYSGQLRLGGAVPPETLRFAARAAWEADTLAFVPYPISDVFAARPWTVPGSAAEAIRRQRQLLRELATTWLATFPQRADALEAFAISLELVADSSAIGLLRRARMAATDPSYQLRLATREIWLLVKFGLPDRLDNLQTARRLGDSLLAHVQPASPEDARSLTTMAALLGRARAAARMARQAGPLSPLATLPSNLEGEAQALLVYAALGAPVDSIRELETRIDGAIPHLLLPAEQARARFALLGQAAGMAFPVWKSPMLESFGRQSYLVEAEAALAVGDRSKAAQVFERLRTARRSLPPGEVSLDALYVEAWLLDALGESAAAVDWLDRGLEALPWSEPLTFANLASPPALVRAAALRAELAGRTGDKQVARRWARAVAILWSGADPALRPVVDRMRNFDR
ncbi:MAG: hypothetical protein HY703_08965 [Gemmatimonadetes bacterium]|nr:hypothetical protein [Gemmatimonadota bacterium]